MSHVYRFSTELLSWFAGIVYSQVVLQGRKLFFPVLYVSVIQTHI